MMKSAAQPHDAGDDPAPSFATDAEIEIADRLRRQLEERYFAPSEPRAASRGGGASATERSEL